MKRAAVLLGLLAVVALTLAPAGGSDAGREVAKPAEVQQGRLVEIGKQAENLRRVLFIELREALKPVDESLSHASSRCRRSPVGHLEATYLPGYGLCITVEMKPSQRPQESDEGDPYAKQWSRINAEREAGLSFLESFIKSRAPSCPACEAQREHYSVARVADTVIQTLAHYGHRLAALQPQERVSVAVHMTGWSGDVLNQMNHSWPRPRSAGPGRSPANAAPRGEDDATPVVAPVVAAPVAVPRQVQDLPASGYAVDHLVLTFTQADLLRYQDGELNLQGLTDRAEVIHY